MPANSRWDLIRVLKGQMSTVIFLVSNIVKTRGNKICCSVVPPEWTGRRTSRTEFLQDVGSDLACSLVDDTGRRFACVLSMESFANTTLCSFSTCGADGRGEFFFPLPGARRHNILILSLGDDVATVCSRWIATVFVPVYLVSV